MLLLCLQGTGCFNEDGIDRNTPDIVFRRMGKKTPRKMIKAADCMPIPNQTIAIGIHASGGMGRITSITGLTSPLTFSDQPMTSPRGTASTTAAR